MGKKQEYTRGTTSGTVDDKSLPLPPEPRMQVKLDPVLKEDGFFSSMANRIAKNPKLRKAFAGVGDDAATIENILKKEFAARAPEFYNEKTAKSTPTPMVEDTPSTVDQQLFIPPTRDMIWPKDQFPELYEQVKKKAPDTIAAVSKQAQPASVSMAQPVAYAQEADTTNVMSQDSNAILSRIMQELQQGTDPNKAMGQAVDLQQQAQAPMQQATPQQKVPLSDTSTGMEGFNLEPIEKQAFAARAGMLASALGAIAYNDNPGMMQFNQQMYQQNQSNLYDAQMKHAMATGQVAQDGYVSGGGTTQQQVESINSMPSAIQARRDNAGSQQREEIRKERTLGLQERGLNAGIKQDQEHQTLQLFDLMLRDQAGSNAAKVDFAKMLITPGQTPDREGLPAGGVESLIGTKISPIFTAISQDPRFSGALGPVQSMLDGAKTPEDKARVLVGFLNSSSELASALSRSYARYESEILQNPLILGKQGALNQILDQELEPYLSGKEPFNISAPEFDANGQPTGNIKLYPVQQSFRGEMTPEQQKANNAWDELQKALR